MYFHDSWTPEVTRAAGKLGIWKYCHYIDFVRRKMIWTAMCKLWHYFTPPHPSDPDRSCITIIKIFLENEIFSYKLMLFLSICTYIMKYNRIWVAEKLWLQLASSYTWQLMWLIQHLKSLSNTTECVTASDCDPMGILVKWWSRNISLVRIFWVIYAITTSVGGEGKVM